MVVGHSITEWVSSRAHQLGFLAYHYGNMAPRADELRLITLFRGFSDAELAEVAALFAPVLPTEVLFSVGQPATTFYLLTAGDVTLERPGDDAYALRPPALIGELGALTGLSRTCEARPSKDAVLWCLDAKVLQTFLGDNQELGVRFLVNLLEIVADKVHRDQRRMADMRTNLVRTQKQLKQLRDLVLDSPEASLSAPVHDALDTLIHTNRRANYRVVPPSAMAAMWRLDIGTAKVVELSRTHVTVEWPSGTAPDVGTWVSGVLDLSGSEIPASGKVIRQAGRRATIELDLMIDLYSAALEGYLTRTQLLDVLV